MITAEESIQKAEDENKRLKYAIQEQDATKERLISAGADYERQEEQYNHEIERLQVSCEEIFGLLPILLSPSLLSFGHFMNLFHIHHQLLQPIQFSSLSFTCRSHFSIVTSSSFFQEKLTKVQVAEEQAGIK